MTRTRGEGGGGELCDLGSGDDELVLGRGGKKKRRRRKKWKKKKWKKKKRSFWVLYGKRRDDVEVCNCVVSV